MLLKNIPNILSIFRILVSPLVFYYIYINNFFSLSVALILFLCGAISDGLDGYYARNYNAISKLGKNLDPIADKILIQLAFISLFIISNVAVKLWMLSLIIFRDILVTYIRHISNQQKITFETSRLAKYKTLFQVITISIILLVMINYQRNLDLVNYVKIFGNSVKLGDVVIYMMASICSLFTFYTGIDYYFKFIKAKNDKQIF